MDKRTLLAVILSTVVISVGFMVQNRLFPPAHVEEQVTVQADRREASDTQAADTVPTQEQRDQQEATRPTLPAEGIIPYGDDPSSRTVSLSTEVFEAVFSTSGAQLVSMRFKEHLENDAPLEFIWASDVNKGAFGIAFGGPDGSAHNVPYNVRTVDRYTLAFYRDFAVETSDGPVPFTLTKTFRFQPEEYLFEVFIRINNSVNAYPALDRDGFAYTLTVGPQIGPAVEKIDGRYEYRRYFTYENGKQKNYRIRNGSAVVDARITWAAVLGKYFAVIGVPDSTNYTVTFTEGAEAGLSTTSKLHFSRPPIRSSVNEDVFRFYMGPKQSSVLTRYNNSDRNAFGTSNLHLEEVMDQGRFLGWLEVILKRVLEFFYTIIPNWGVAIILLTIFVKLLLFPITHKSYESTSKMQTLQPKMTEIREKYKDNPTKMNQEMAALYKREKVNPMGGCLPLLLQMPIFIALYGLFNKYFDLRGAAFIPGWISDLSSPETIWNFAPVQLPLLGWSDLRLLPILFVGTMVLSSKLMQNPGTGSQNSQMKMMTYMMPIVFFFILYDAPSGLLVYWIVTNFLTIVQQKIIGLVQKKKG